MTERSLEKIVQRAMGRWQITDVVVIHRIGMLSVSDQIVLVAVASQHRQTAFNACEFIMDYLKTEAPFWKKEMNDDDGQWVDTREVDLHALRKWKIK
jgi:molybdopterin synthase catalytic subunit